MLNLSADPWQWPDLDAEQLGELSSLSSAKYSDAPDAPIFQYVAVRQCLALRPEIEVGDVGSGFSVLEAVSICAMRGLTMPDWLASAFLRRYRAVSHYKAKSWDDPLSFGRPFPKGTNIQAKKKARSLSTRVWLAVRDIQDGDPTTPIDKSLFERVGAPLAIGATLTEEYYYNQKRYWAKRFYKSDPTDTPAVPYLVGAVNPAKKRNSAGLRKQRK